MPNKLPTYRPGRDKPQRPAGPRPSPSARGYGRRWQLVRLMKLQRDPLCECQECKVGGLIVEATEVDHIDGDVNNVTDGNLMSMSKACHSRKTCRENGGLGNRRR